MERGPRPAWPARTLGTLGLAALVVLGVLVRLEEPLSNPVLPAEDPFTHMVRTKAHLYAGGFEAQTPTDELYPPGMHAAIGVVWIFSGGDLYPLFRFAPVLLGGLGVLGVGVLLWRHAGVVAGLVGAFAMALAPELVFRTTMMAPTAVDVGILAFVVYALLELVTGRMAWAPIAAVLVAFLVFTHPWLLGILAASGLLFVLLAAVLPWSAARWPPSSARGLTSAAAIVGTGFGLVLSTCGGLCGPGFQEVIGLEGLQLVSPLVVVLSLLPAALLLVRPGAMDWVSGTQPRSRSRALRVLVSLLLGVLLAGVLAAGRATGMPEFVHLPRMLGWPLLALGALAVLAVPFLADPLSYAGASVTLATLPLVHFDLFEAFVAHRAVVYLGFGLVLLLGGLAGGATRWIRAGLQRASGAGPSPRSSWTLTVVPSLLVAGAFGAGVAAGTPEPYPDGWYRLYEPCEIDALREVGEVVEEHPSTLVVTGDWRPGVVLPAVASAEPRIWYHEAFFGDPDEREVLITDVARSPGTLYVVEDRHLRHNQDPSRRAFLDDPEWRVQDTWCQQELGRLHVVHLLVNERTR